MFNSCEDKMLSELTNQLTILRNMLYEILPSNVSFHRSNTYYIMEIPRRRYHLSTYPLELRCNFSTLYQSCTRRMANCVPPQLMLARITGTCSLGDDVGFNIWTTFPRDRKVTIFERNIVDKYQGILWQMMRTFRLMIFSQNKFI